MNMNDRIDPTPDRTVVMIPISAIWRWWKDRRIKRDLDNIKRYEEIHESD